MPMTRIARNASTMMKTMSYHFLTGSRIILSSPSSTTTSKPSPEHLPAVHIPAPLHSSRVHVNQIGKPCQIKFKTILVCWSGPSVMKIMTIPHEARTKRFTETTTHAHCTYTRNRYLQCLFKQSSPIHSSATAFPSSPLNTKNLLMM